MNKRTREEREDRGFAMLFAVLVSSVLLSIGLSIFNLTIKELTLSSAGRESQFAFFASDSGIECAFYWDYKIGRIFATSTPFTPTNPSPDCVNTFGASAQIINVTPSSMSATAATTTFELIIPNKDALENDAPYCASVTVAKNLVGAIIRTTIDSRGYNTCDPADPNRVERAIRVTY